MNNNKNQEAGRNRKQERRWKNRTIKIAREEYPLQVAVKKSDKKGYQT